jgi:hypothetical protein
VVTEPYTFNPRRQDMSEQSDVNKNQEILSQRDAQGNIIHDQVKQDVATGKTLARRHDDHTQWDVVA